MSDFEIVQLTDPINNVVIVGGLVPKGAYDNTTDYTVGDLVSYLGNSYVQFSEAPAGTLPTNVTYWMPVAMGTQPIGGSDTQVQFNDGGALGGNAGLSYDKASQNLKATILSINNTPSLGSIDFYSDDGITLVGSVWVDPAGNYVFYNPGNTSQGILDFSTIIGANKTFTLPDKSGTVALLDDATYNAVANIPVEPPVDDTASGPNTNDIQAGATIAQWECVYLSANGKWLRTDADAASTSAGLLGLALEAKNNNQAMNVALPGSLCRNDGWNWTTVGAPLYLSTVTGAITDVQPSGTDDVIRVIGYATTSHSIWFDPSNDYITHI